MASSDNVARYDVSIPRTAIPYVLALAKTGLYGSTPEAVMCQLVVQGLRAALADGLIPSRMTGDMGVGGKPGD